MVDLPVACTLPPDALAARQANLLRSLLPRAQERLVLPDGYRIRFPPDPDILVAIAHTIDAERLCCRFLRFTVVVEPDGGAILLDLTGPEGTREFLAALFEL